MKILAQSNNVIIQSEFEVVELEFKKSSGLKKRSVIIGDFYGDPNCAMISEDEKYCVVGGSGLIVYWIKDPLESYEYYKKTNQYQEYFRDKDDTWWIENVYEADDEYKIRFVVDPSDEIRKGVYELNVLNGETTKLI